MKQEAYKYLDEIRRLREKAQAESALEAELCSAVVFLLRREQEREMEAIHRSTSENP